MDDLTKLRGDFRRNLFARRRTPGTVTAYLECVDGFIAWLQQEGRSTDATRVTRRTLESYLVDLSMRPQKRYSWKPVSSATVA